MTIVTRGAGFSHVLFRSYRALVIASFLGALSCIPAQIRVDQTGIATLSRAPVVNAITYKPDRFSLRTRGELAAPVAAVSFPAGLALAIIAGAAVDEYDRRKGETFAGTVGLEDPVTDLREEFLRALKSELNIDNIRVRTSVLDHDDIRTVRRTFPDGLVLDFKTENWTLIPFSFSARYWMTYLARARLIEMTRGDVIWTDKCFVAQKDRAASLDDLTANSAEQLKANLRDAAKTCAEELVQLFFNRDPAAQLVPKRP